MVLLTPPLNLPHCNCYVWPRLGFFFPVWTTWEAESIVTPKGILYHVDFDWVWIVFVTQMHNYVSHCCYTSINSQGQKRKAKDDCTKGRRTDQSGLHTDHMQRMMVPNQDLAFLQEGKCDNVSRWIRSRHANEIQKQQWQPKWVWGLKAYFRVH